MKTLQVLLLIMGAAPWGDVRAQGDAGDQFVLHDLLSAMDETVVTQAEGEMVFAVNFSPSKDVTQSFNGRVFWLYPCIRWEYERKRVELGSTSTSKEILIDSPNEIVRYVISAKQVYRSVDRTKTYDSWLRIAPWQIWIEANGQVPWADVLNANTLANGSNRTYTATCDDRGYRVLLKSPLATLDILFDRDSGLFSEYESCPHVDALPSSNAIAGIAEWVRDEDERIFPKRMVFWKWNPANGESKSEPFFVLECKDHKSACSISSDGFKLSSLQLEADTYQTTFREGKQPVVAKAGSVDENISEKLQVLGKQLSKKGFASEDREN